MLDHDRFTFTVAGREFQDVNWLTQVGYYFLFEQGGLALVQCVNALLLALTMALLVLLCRRISGSLGVAAAVGIVTFFGLWQVLTIRPQTCSLLLFVLLYSLLDAAARRPWLLFVPPVLLALWANLHGAFPAGLLLLGCFLLARAWEAWKAGQPVLADVFLRRLALCLGVSVLATLVNPYGWGVYQYVGLTSNTAAARRIDEWVPPSFDQWIGLAFFVSLALLAGLLLANWLRLGRRPSAREVILIACFLPLAAGSIRMAAWWLLVIAPILSAALAALLRADGKVTPRLQPTRGATIVFALLLLAVVFCLPALQAYHPLLQFTRQGTRTEDDLEAVQHHLRTQHAATGRIFSRFEWGEYLTWSASPDYRVFMDGRIEIYPDEVWTQYEAVTCGKDNWQQILNTYAVDYLFLDATYHTRTGLLPRVAASPDWRQVYASRNVLLFVRRIR
jgi:hypothetical protein